MCRAGHSLIHSLASGRRQGSYATARWCRGALTHPIVVPLSLSVVFYSRSRCVRTQGKCKPAVGGRRRIGPTYVNSRGASFLRVGSQRRLSLREYQLQLFLAESMILHRAQNLAYRLK